jgi:hypothetical protein
MELLHTAFTHGNARHKVAGTVGILLIVPAVRGARRWVANHAREVAAPRGVCMYEEAEALLLKVVSQRDYILERVNDTFLGRSNDGNDGVDGLLFVKAFLEKFLKVGNINSCIVVNRNTDAVIRSNTNESCKSIRNIDS